MTTAGSGPRGAIEAELRESKDRIAIDVLELCAELHIRAMVGGDPVLTAHGLLTPAVSRNASLFVDPASIRHLHRALLELGWRDAREPRAPHLLPQERLMLTHSKEAGGLYLYGVVPGFFADPEETFDRIWERHKEISLRGTRVRALGRLTSAILASRDSFEARAGQQRNNFGYFVNQFQILLTDQERMAVVDLVRQFGGCAEMSALFEALGVEPCSFTLPSVSYVQWRLGVADVSEQTRRAVAMLELAPHGRDMLYRSRTGRPGSLSDVADIARGLPTTVRAIFGSRRRVKRQQRDAQVGIA